jgi:hypothetical protein
MQHRSTIFVLMFLLCVVACTDKPAETTIVLNLDSGTPIEAPPPGGGSSDGEDGGVTTGGDDGTGTSGGDPGETPPPALNACQVTVGRTEDTKHPNPAMQKFVLAINDRFRTLIDRDLWVGEDAGRFLIDCTIPAGSVAQRMDTDGLGAILPVYQMSGMPPKNFFIERKRPGVTGAIGRNGKRLRLLPFNMTGANPETKTLAEIAVSTLPQPTFDFSALSAEMPDASVAMRTGGQYQINNVLRFDISFTEASTSKAASTDDAPVATSVRFKALGVAGPDGCAWATSSCPKSIRVPNVQERYLLDGTAIQPGRIIDTIYETLEKIIADEHEAGRRTDSTAVIAKLMERLTYDTSGWLYLNYKIVAGVTVGKSSSANGDIDVPLLVWTPDMMSAMGGGCGCHIQCTR